MTPADDTRRPPPDANAAPGIGHVAARGMFWMTLGGVAARVVGFAQLVGLAWFLNPESFGLLTMASTAVALASVALNVGLTEILIQRQKRFRLWAPSALWLSVLVGVGTMGLIALAAPVAAWFYGSWRVAGLVLVMALTVPVTSVAAVPMARLSAERRFRAMAAVGMVSIVSMTLVSLPLAALGFGAMSVAIANLVATALSTIAYWRLAGAIPFGPPRPRRWRYFARDTSLLVGSRLATAVCSNIDFILVGRLAGQGPLGVYSYAYNQSLQATRLLAGTAMGVLFPSLGGLESDARRYTAFSRGMRLVLPILIPFCFAQAALAEPAFRLLFRPEYWPGIRLFQILSVGSFGIGATTLCVGLLLSLRRNDLNLILALASAGVYAIAASIGYATAGTTGVAVGMSIGATANLAIAHALAARAVGERAMPALAWYGRPMLLATLAAGPTLWVVEHLLGERAAIARLFVGTLCFGVIYLAALPLLARPTFDELVFRMRRRRGGR